MPTTEGNLRTPDTEHKVCVHLWENRDNDYLKIFTGQGRTYLLACPECSKNEDFAEISWQIVDAATFADIEWEANWDGIRGTPEILESPLPLSFVHRTVPQPASIRLVQPISQSTGSQWIAVTADHSLIEIDLDAGTHHIITKITSTDLDIGKHYSLICSANGTLICLTETRGEKGLVIASASGQRLFRWQRDDYKTYANPFAAAFLVHAGRTLLIHATAWNRLDISDPRTDELLTKRSPTSYRRGEERPEHYLDYFHSTLLIAPNQDYVIDNGWIWGPAGIVTSWSTQRWLSANVWESEDGPTRKRLLERNFWGRPLCWIDNRTVAVWGYGKDDDWLLAAVYLIDVVTGKETTWFAGPEVVADIETKGVKHLRRFGGNLYFDRYLFSVSERFGVSVWDVKSGARVHQDTSFAPIGYHMVTKEFLTIREDGTLQLSRLVETQ